MAQGDVIQIALGDTVTVAVQLDFKQAAVDRRPDKANFALVGPLLREATKNKETSSEVVTPDQVFATDDRQVEFQIQFVNPPQNPDFFVTGETWDVFLQYRANGESPHNDPARTHLLGRVGIGVTPTRR